MIRALALCLLFVPSAWGQRWPEALVRRLESQPIRSAQNLEQAVLEQGRAWEGSNSLWLLELLDGTRAVFRSEDQPWGSQAEIAGYRFTRWLGLEMVPPTVLRILHQSEWPGAVPWPFPSALRTGSMQLYLRGKTGPAVPVDPLVQADIEVVSFVLGRYDNHSGNLLIDEHGQACLVDFENSLEIQRARYGEPPYARRGEKRPDLPSLSARQPFPFDRPETLVNPSQQEIEQRFSPWWTYWPQGMGELYHQLQHLDDKTVRYTLWDSHLWVQVRARSRHPAWTQVYRESTMRRLAQLDSTTLQQLLPVPYTQEHVRGILERARQVLSAWDPKN
jgi:hypothetical protein